MLPNQQRQITLCDRLSLALRVLKVQVADAGALIRLVIRGHHTGFVVLLVVIGG
jgi:hypothetical protein